MGTAYCMLILCAAVGVGISKPFTRQLSIWGIGIISCGFWYALLLLVVEELVGFMFTVMQKWYKKRKRKTYCRTSTSLLRDAMIKTANCVIPTVTTCKYNTVKSGK